MLSLLLIAQLSADMDPTLVAQELLRAIGAGQHALAVVVAVLGLTIVVRRFGGRLPWIGPRIAPWLATPVGAITVAVVGSVAGALATAFMAGEALSVALILRALMVAVVALLPSAAVSRADAKGKAAAAEVTDLSRALEELNRKP